MYRSKKLRNSVLIIGFFTLSACADGQMPGFLQPKSGGEDVVARAATGGETTVSTERDIEAPEIFQATEAGLWDGRPSLGGVWVAHPDVSEPERVIIRNETNGQFVIGALFRRERQTPGPRLQVSSDAAAAIGMLAGAPTNLNVVALKREEVPAPAPLAEADAVAFDMSDPAALAEAVPAAPGVDSGTLDPVVAGATQVIETAALDPAPTPVLAAPIASVEKPVIEAAAPAAPAQPKRSTLSKPFVQIGIFSVEQNAKNTATAMRQAGMVPTIKQHTSNGKTFWRVVVGPATSKSELQTLLKTIKGTGFTDAYAVSG